MTTNYITPLHCSLSCRIRPYSRLNREVAGIAIGCLTASDRVATRQQGRGLRSWRGWWIILFVVVYDLGVEGWRHRRGRLRGLRGWEGVTICREPGAWCAALQTVEVNDYTASASSLALQAIHGIGQSLDYLPGAGPWVGEAS